MKDLNGQFLQVRKNNKDYRINLLHLDYPEIGDDQIILHFNNTTTFTLNRLEEGVSNGLSGNVEGDEFDRLRQFFLDMGFDLKSDE